MTVGSGFYDKIIEVMFGVGYIGHVTLPHVEVENDCKQV